MCIALYIQQALTNLVNPNMVAIYETEMTASSVLPTSKLFVQFLIQ